MVSVTRNLFLLDYIISGCDEPVVNHVKSNAQIINILNPQYRLLLHCN